MHQTLFLTLTYGELELHGLKHHQQFKKNKGKKINRENCPFVILRVICSASASAPFSAVSLKSNAALCLYSAVLLCRIFSVSKLSPNSLSALYL